MLWFMAIFGDLSDMPTPEVLKTLRSRTGKLYLRPGLRGQYELHLHEGEVLCLKENEVSVPEGVALRRTLTSLLELKRGGFEFSQTPLGALEHVVNVTREEVRRLSAALEADAGVETDVETTAADRALGRATRFKLTDGAQNDADLPENIQTFLRRAHDLLSAGCSASELAEALGVHTPFVQLYFKRLRSLGVITPVRAYAPNYGFSAAPPAEPAPPRPAQPQLVQSQPIQPVAAPVRQVVTEPPPVQPARPKQGFVRRLLSALSFGGR